MTYNCVYYVFMAFTGILFMHKTCGTLFHFPFAQAAN